MVFCLKIRNFRCNKKIDMKNYILSKKRAEMVNSGAYDGRFREKVVVDKKKKESKFKCRKNFSKNFENI